MDPERGKVPLLDYARQWIDQRAGLRPRTVELYRWLLGKHIAPYLGSAQLGKITTAAVRQWRADLLAAGVSESMAAKSYRLLRAILNTAVVEDKILTAQPVPCAWGRQGEPGRATDAHRGAGVRPGGPDAEASVSAC